MFIDCAEEQPRWLSNGEQRDTRSKDSKVNVGEMRQDKSGNNVKENFDDVYGQYKKNQVKKPLHRIGTTYTVQAQNTTEHWVITLHTMNTSN